MLGVSQRITSFLRSKLNAIFTIKLFCFKKHIAKQIQFLKTRKNILSLLKKISLQFFKHWSFLKNKNKGIIKSMKMHCFDWEKKKRRKLINSIGGPWNKHWKTTKCVVRNFTLPWSRQNKFLFLISLPFLLDMLLNSYPKVF